MTEEILELETRRRIYDLLSRFPGLHMREIQRQLDMSIALVEYHLRELEKMEVIKSIEEGGYKRYYTKPRVSGKDGQLVLGYKEQRILAVLRQKIPLQITLLLLKNENMKHGDISNYIEVSPSKLSFHIKKLINLKIINHNRLGKNKGYSISNKNELTRLLIAYKPPVDMIDGFIELWESIF